ncbi:hypothetical protein I302_106493 [Kwoniella bestiolae CBS 10118]|uniref:Uncharacterized protein n=1 Tax=Kwoniella bestiolae CBS 10118 TaxID=1296100 RepID=A0A1B9G1A3_9TREE|nr:hypothetical protein I302_06249 [Kwoniella bestiolae CBS 10118]OCF24788.1 hypothetical protein I302_06249 [Kwoniella bestiolae CBS 10118]
MALLSFQHFLDGLDDSLTPPAAPAPALAPTSPSPPREPKKKIPIPKFADDLLSAIFDLFTATGNFAHLKIAVQVNTFLYNRYQPRLYRYIKFDKYNIDDFQLHATLNLASSDSQSPPRRNRDRFLNLCHSIIHLEITDEETSQKIVQVLISRELRGSQTLFKSVEYLILRNEFMRFLQKVDYHALDRTLHSKRVVQLLGRYLKPRHLCIENLRAYDKKNSKSPEVWKVEILKGGWKLDSMTLHHDVGSTRMIFTDVPLQQFFPNPPLGVSSSVLAPSTEDDTCYTKTKVEIYQDYSNHSVIVPADLQNRIKVGDVKIYEESSLGRCTCCVRS